MKFYTNSQMLQVHTAYKRNPRRWQPWYCPPLPLFLASLDSMQPLLISLVNYKKPAKCGAIFEPWVLVTPSFNANSPHRDTS